MEPLRVGVAGCASIALRRMLPAMAAAPRTEVVAIASRDGRRAERAARAFGCRPVTGYAALLELAEVEAVYVPLPLALHAEWTEAALRAGKHVLVEKPMTTDPARTRELLDLARRGGLVLMENVMFVHHRQHAVVRDLLDGGAIGEVRSLHAAFTVPERPDGDIRYERALGGGALWDVGVYPVRAALHLLGPELEVVGAHQRVAPGRVVDTSGAALLRSPKGVGVQVAYGLENFYTATYTVNGSEGRLTLDMAFTPPADRVPVIRVERPSGVEEMRLAPDDQVANTVAAFAEAVRTGAGSPDAEVCLRQAVLLDAIRRRAARQ
ncbi:Gfo/Idh/MocA family oxidoreductase [Actinomadura miaoliensis]|uniref:Gfo/Idh/MocA family oxidoreductase n=1 Tax=Actinomadura miaoliensis TaxID=430685 RepID=A0ABP7WN04_9ACTN